MRESGATIVVYPTTELMADQFHFITTSTNLRTQVFGSLLEMSLKEGAEEDLFAGDMDIGKSSI
jgi:hypothetical protein